MTTLTLRSVKGSPLTVQEVDNNFEWLQDQIDLKLNSADLTSSYILNELKTVDGSGSGLDADTVDGLNAETLTVSNSLVARDASGDFSAGTITASLIGNVTGNVSGTSNTITSILPVTLGGTGSNNSTGALTNLLPALPINSSGYVLKTFGAGNYQWGPQTGNVTTAGTRVDSQRIIVTATANQTVFTVPTYIPGSNQLRVYIDGVRQFDSEYTETSSTSFTFNSGVDAGAEVMIEVDGYIEYTLAASEVTYSPSGTMNSLNVQDALDEIHGSLGSLAVKNTVATVDIDNDAITTDKLADSSVTAPKIAAGAIGASEIVDKVIGASKLNVVGNGTTSQYLRSDGDGSFTWDTPVGYTGPKLDIFTSSGTWTVPNGVTSCKVFVIGGGGAGRVGWSPTSGGQGGWVQAYVTGLTSGSNITVTVGNGGAFQGGAGGTSSFGSYATGTGGGGVNGNPPNHVNGSGSVGSGATLLTRGNNGTSVYNNTFFSSITGFPDWLQGEWRGRIRNATYGAGTNTSQLTWTTTNDIYPGAPGVSNNASNGSGTYAGVKGIVAIMY